MSFCRKLWLLCGVTLASPLLAAQDGDPELGFGNAGFRNLDTVAAGAVPNNERGLFSTRLADGRLLTVFQIQEPAAQRAGVSLFDASAQDLLSAATLPVNFNAGLDPPLRGFGLDAAGRLWIAGNSLNAAGTLVDPLIVRTLPPNYDTLDPDFGDAGEVRPLPGEAFATILGLAVLADGRSIACGQIFIQAEGGSRGFCIRLDAQGNMDWSFGNGGRFIFNPVAGAVSQIAGVNVDSTGRLLLAGEIVLPTRASRHPFSARLTADGQLDPGYCADGCNDALLINSAPGFRIDLAQSPDSRLCLKMQQRDPGLLVVGPVLAPPDFVLFRRFDSDGRWLGQNFVFTAGGFVGGCPQLSFQDDGRPVIAHTFITAANVQVGALVRHVAAPANGSANTLDPEFSPAARQIRSPLPGSEASGSNECNHALVEADGILCTGLTRVGNEPLNIDLMLARVRNGVVVMFADGFE